MEKQVSWYIYTKKADFEALGREYGISPLVARILINRDIKAEDMGKYLHPQESDMHHPEGLKDAVNAAAFLAQALREGKKIRVVGDYDIDGVCATYILTAALQKLQAKVSYEIPDRIRDGYGINEDIIAEAKKEEVDILLTCDNGIAAFSALARARELGMRTIVTDHHDVRREEGQDVLPEADFIVNPKRQDCTYPFTGICGALLAYKLMQLLFARMGREADFPEELFAFAAIATVGDVMPLRDENRYIVKRGLEEIAESRNMGLRLLLAECDLENKRLSPFHIGFIIGPCLNAGGRLRSAKLALQLFLEQDREKAGVLAKELVVLNNERKDMTARGVLQATQEVESKYKEDKVLVLYLPDCHESLAGIIAGRIKEKYYRPCIVLTDTPHGFLKGSARSIAAYNMFEKLSEAAAFLDKYGGHPMAAGLSLQVEVLEEFRTFLNVHAGLGQEDFVEKIWIDSLLPFAYAGENLIAELSALEPFGQGNEKPNFALKDVRILESRLLGKDKNVLKMLLQDSYGSRLPAVLFAEGEDFLEKTSRSDKIDILYYPEINEYMGVRRVQIVIKDWKISRI